VADVVDGPLGADASETGNRQRGGHRLDFIGAEHALAGVELPGASVDAAAVPAEQPTLTATTRTLAKAAADRKHLFKARVRRLTPSNCRSPSVQTAISSTRS